MGFIEKRSGHYRARYADPLGKLHSKTFRRKADADRFIREMEIEIDRGTWLDPRTGPCRWPSGRRSSCLSPDGCRLRRRRPTGGPGEVHPPSLRRLPARSAAFRRERELV